MRLNWKVTVCSSSTCFFRLLISRFPDEVNFETIDGAIVLFDIPKDANVRITVPHSDASAFHVMVSMRFSHTQTGAHYL